MTPGERWSADELLALRAARFAPRGWWRFLCASFRRAGETRRTRPELAHQAHRWAAAGLAAGVAACAGARRAGIPAPRPAVWAAWWLASGAMLDWHLGMVEGPAGERRTQLAAPDAVTLARIGLAPFIAAHAQPARDGASFAGMLGAAAASDLLDGQLARRHGPTRLGRDLDTVADVLVGGAAVHAARRAGWLTPFAARLAMARYAAPVAVVAVAYFQTGQRVARTSFGANRCAANVALAGIVASPAAPRLASAVTCAGSLATLALAIAGRRATSAGPPELTRDAHAATPVVS